MPEKICYHEHIEQVPKNGNLCWFAVHLNDDRETVILDFNGGYTSSMHHMTKKDLENLRNHINAVLPLMLPEDPCGDVPCSDCHIGGCDHGT